MSIFPYINITYRKNLPGGYKYGMGWGVIHNYSNTFALIGCAALSILSCITLFPEPLSELLSLEP